MIGTVFLPTMSATAFRPVYLIDAQTTPNAGYQSGPGATWPKAPFPAGCVPLSVQNDAAQDVVGGVHAHGGTNSFMPMVEQPAQDTQPQQQCFAKPKLNPEPAPQPEEPAPEVEEEELAPPGPGSKAQVESEEPEAHEPSPNQRHKENWERWMVQRWRNQESGGGRATGVHERYADPIDYDHWGQPSDTQFSFKTPLWSTGLHTMENCVQQLEAVAPEQIALKKARAVSDMDAYRSNVLKTKLC